MDTLGLVAFLLVAGAAVASGVRARLRAAAAFALAAGVLVAWAGAVALRGALVFWIEPAPLAAASWTLLAVGVLAASVTVLAFALPTRVARFIPVALLAIFVAWLAWFVVGDATTRAWNPLFPLLVVVGALSLPRTVQLAREGATPKLVGGAAGGVLALAAFPAAMALALMSVLGGSGPAVTFEWEASITPDAAGHYAAQVPFVTANVTTMRSVLDELRANVTASGANATVRATPDGGGFLVTADGPVTLSATVTLLAEGSDRFDVSHASLTSVPWSYHGGGVALAEWRLGWHCGGAQLHDALWIDANGRTDAPTGARAPPSAPTQPPCVHGD